MARQLRLQYAGAVYHVVNRDDRREAIVHDDEDRRRFLETLAEACAQTGWQLHAYGLMPNHFHLVMETPQPNLVAGMKWFLGTYGAELHEGEEAKAERWVQGKLARRKGSEADLGSTPKTDRCKAGMARRLRRETTMTLGWIARRLRREGVIKGSRRSACFCVDGWGGVAQPARMARKLRV